MESHLQEQIPPLNLKRSSWEDIRIVTADGKFNEVSNLFSFWLLGESRARSFNLITLLQPNCSALTHKLVDLLDTYASSPVINKLSNFLGQMCFICSSSTSSKSFSFNGKL